MTLWPTEPVALARRYLWVAMCFLLLGGTLAMLMRWQLGFPGRPVPGGEALFPNSSGAVTPDAYAKLFTMHGLVMIFFGVAPILINAFGNLIVPLQIGARRMAFASVAPIGFYIFIVSGGLMIASFWGPLGTASAGWTSYPPLATHVGTPGWGETLVLLALGLNGVSTVITALSIVVTVVRFRAPGMSWLRIPAATWSIFLASILNVLFVPVLLAATVLLVCDRVLGSGFFVAGALGNGEPLAYQHLFWIFGHPEVYILILPAWGIVTDLVSFFSRKPAFSYRLTIGAMCAITALSGLVYGHHMFVAGMSPMLGQAFMATTLIITVPSFVLALNWLQTLWRGDIQLTAPMLYALGVIIVFGIGGLTGALLGDVAIDIYLHDTMYVVGHFHFVMAAATLMGIFAGLHYWAPLLFGRRLDERLARLHFALTLPLLVLVFAGILLAGHAGQPRRYFDPYQLEFVRGLLPLNRHISYAAFVLFISQLPFVIAIVRALRGPAEVPNPWRIGTLEWLPANSAAQVVRGPHEVGDDGAFLSQAGAP